MGFQGNDGTDLPQDDSLGRLVLVSTDDHTNAPTGPEVSTGGPIAGGGTSVSDDRHTHAYTQGGGSTPSGTGWVHITAGVQDAASSTPSASNVGLGNCDNTSDANKPVSTAQATAIQAAIYDAISSALMRC